MTTADWLAQAERLFEVAHVYHVHGETKLDKTTARAARRIGKFCARMAGVNARRRDELPARVSAGR